MNIQVPVELSFPEDKYCENTILWSLHEWKETNDTKSFQLLNFP